MEPSTKQNNHLQIKEHKIHITGTGRCVNMNIT